MALSIVHTHTYVVQRQVWIKIGATSRPKKRVQELSLFAWHKYVHSPRHMDWTQPLHLRAMLDGDMEHDLHVRFSDAHVIGEWFLETLAIRRWIEEVTYSART